MADKKSNSRLLRKLAEEICQSLIAEGRLLEAEGGDFITSLVRQWITYDGNATWFFDGEQVQFVHRHTPLGKPLLAMEQITPAWFAELQRQWKVDPEEFPRIVEQMNRGQSAETTNTEGIQLRLWVNPKEKKVGVEKLVTKPALPGAKPDNRMIAANELVKRLGVAVDKEELEALACSVAKQWQQFEGHACIFLDRGQRLVLILTEKENGRQVVTSIETGDLAPLLSSFGFSPAEIPDVIAHINLGQAIEFRDKEGVPSLLRHNPKEKKIQIRPRDYAFANAKFKLGTIEIEPRASMVLGRSGQDAGIFLQRHAKGDWGDLSDREKFENEYRLKKGDFVRSCYRTSLGESVLVSTTADRQRTVVSAPDPEIAKEMVRMAQAHANLIVFCPKCKAALQRWEGSEEQRTCSQCGHSFFRSGRP